jgi:hypothetical protein
MAKKQRPLKLRRASAYFRLAAKADRAGNYIQARQYRDIADRLVESNRRDQEALARRRAAPRLR